MSNIQNFLKQISPTAGDKSWQSFESKLEHYLLEKNRLLIKPGQTEQYLYFIEKGVLRFYLQQGEKEITFDFAFQGNITSAYTSFVTRQPVQYFIQALTTVSLYRINYEDLQAVYATGAQAEMMGRLAAEQLFVRKAKRELSLLTETAEERYLKLMAEQSQLIQQIPLKYLASYIGITPQALSRIRKRIS